MSALIPKHSPTIMREAESFLDALKYEVRSTGILEDGLTRTSEEMDVDERYEPQSRRESGIWEGTFGEKEGPRIQRLPIIDDRKNTQRTEMKQTDMHADTPTSGPKLSLGIWVVEHGGLLASNIIKTIFDVSPEMALAAKKWCDGPDSESDRIEHIIVNLCCFLESELAARGIVVNDTDCLEKLRTIESSWPLTCLCIQINGHVWLPSDLTSQREPIGINQGIRSGSNELELVQISGTSRLVFVVTATYPSEEEFQRARKKKRLLQLIRSRPQPKELVVPASITA